MPIRTTRYIIQAAERIAANESIDEDTRKRLVDSLMTLAGARQAKNVDRFGRLVYRIIAVSLGLVAVLVVIFAFVVQQTGHASIDAAFYALGSGAIGGLGGVLAPAGLGAPVSAPQPGESQPTVPNQPPANGNN